jgi:uncharacterized protein
MNRQSVATPQAQRIEAIDALRGLALLGVLVVNLLTEFRVSIFEQFVGAAPPTTALDRFVAGLVSLGVEGKAICLFSLLFGFGLAMQFDRLSRTHRPYYRLGRRLLALLGFGVIHLVFVWNGDILTEYAVMGLLVLPFIGMSARVLGLAAASLLALYAVLPFLPIPISLPDREALQAHVDAADSIYSSGGIIEVWRFSVSELRLLLPLHVFILPRTLGLFFLGAYLWRSGLLQPATNQSSRMGIASATLVVAGAVLTFAAANRENVQLGVLGPALLQLGPAVLALGYAASVIYLSRYGAVARLLSVFAPMGRMAFTNYLSQSLIFCLLFFGYGLGLYGRCGVAATLILGVAVYVIQLIWSAWWLDRFRFGPLEWCWRSMTYGRPQPLRRSMVRAQEREVVPERA